MQKILLLLLFALPFQFQTPAQTAFSSEQLKELLDKAERATRVYSETFKNLSATERKTIRAFRRDNSIEETREIESNFIVYESPRTGAVNEFRNVVEFNGKNVQPSNRKIADFFERLAKSDSDAEEYKRIRDEGQRFDGRVTAWGMTLWQDAPFGARRSFFAFKFVEATKIEGRDALVIEYEQIKPTALIVANPTAAERAVKTPGGREYSTFVSDNLRPTHPRMRGKIWLDRETVQIWRNEFQIVLHPANLSKPVVSAEFVFEYQPSDFKILVPKSFRMVNYQINGKTDKDLRVTKDRERVFEYSKFREARSEIKKYEIEGKQ